MTNLHMAAFDAIALTQRINANLSYEGDRQDELGVKNK